MKRDWKTIFLNMPEEQRIEMLLKMLKKRERTSPSHIWQKNTPHLRTAVQSFLVGLVGLAILPEHPIAIPASFGTSISFSIIIETVLSLRKKHTISAHWV